LGTDFQNTGLLPAFAKLAVKYRPGQWNTGHLATLLPDRDPTGFCNSEPDPVRTGFL